VLEALVIVQERVVRNARGVGSIGIAHPDPDDAVTLLDHVGLQGRCARDLAVTVRVVHAGALAVEAQPVVRTLHRAIRRERALVQRGEAVWTGVRHRHQAAFGRPVDQHGLVEQRPVEER